MVGGWSSTLRRNAHIEFGARSDSSPAEASCYVRDDGAGFDPAYTDKLFQPFQRLHGMTEFPGNGVGLASVRRIVELLGGRTWALDEVDQGATIGFTLPAPERHDGGRTGSAIAPGGRLQTPDMNPAFR
jgi:light-regulated signal transduction histidine kinase (bacteriophytochrome)